MDEKGAAPAPRAPVGGPSPSTTPPALGAYAVTGRWHQDPTGQVLSGRDPAGREVELVLLAPGPASDPAARDRFAAAAETLGREQPGRLVEASGPGPLAWVALASGSGPALARPLLESATPPGSDGGSVSGPDFSPHWSGTGAAYPVLPPPSFVAPPAPARQPAWRRWWWIALVVALVLLLLLSACWPRGGGGPTPGPSGTQSPGPSGTQSPSPSPSGSPTPSPSGTGPSGSGSPTPSNSAGGEPGSELPEQPLAEGPGLGGEQFGEDDATVEQRLAGLPFPFRVPDGWQCVRSVQEQDGVLYLCMDFEAVAKDPTQTAASGLIEVTSCGGPCDQIEWALLRGVRSEDDGYALVDPGTLLAQDQDPYRPDFRRVRMSRVYDPEGGPEPTVHVYVEFSAGAEQFREVAQVVEDVRVNTP